MKVRVFEAQNQEIQHEYLCIFCTFVKLSRGFREKNPKYFHIINLVLEDMSFFVSPAILTIFICKMPKCRASTNVVLTTIFFEL